MDVSCCRSSSSSSILRRRTCAWRGRCLRLPDVACAAAGSTAAVRSDRSADRCGPLQARPMPAIAPQLAEPAPQRRQRQRTGIPARAHAPHPPGLPAQRRRCQGPSCASEIPDLRDDEFAAWDQADLLEHLVIDGERATSIARTSNLFRLSPQARARRASRRRSTTARWSRRIRITTKMRDAALATGKQQRRAAARARHLVDHVDADCRARRRDRARVDSVSARDCRASRKTSRLIGERAGEARRSRRNRRCSAPSTWSSRRAPDSRRSSRSATS